MNQRKPQKLSVMTQSLS